MRDTADMPWVAGLTRAATRVWDLPTRLWHWTMVLLFLVSWRTAEVGLIDLHKISGGAVLALVLFRIYWGVFGSATSRFSSWSRLARSRSPDHVSVVASCQRMMPGGEMPAL